MTAVKMEGANPPRGPKILWTFHSQEDLNQYALGCDADIGGTSTCNLTMGDSGKARFWGDMRLAVKPGLERRVRGGYAGFRNKVSLASRTPRLAQGLIRCMSRPVGLYLER